MDMFEKVEKLKEKADVTYEEARDALQKADGDILEALILLEKEGKAKKPGNSYSTEYDRSEEKNKKEGDKSEKGKHKGKACGFIEKTKELFRKSITNYLVIKSKEDTKAKIPILAAVVILIFAWHISVVAIIVSLFFGCRYSFEGEDDMESANKACDTVCDKAEEIVADIVEVPSKDVTSEEESTEETKE